MDTQFLNEHLRPGQLGHFFAILSFVGALFSAFSYFRAAQTEKDLVNSTSWLQLGRNGFIVHAASVIGIFFTLFYIITNHLFEYNYAWEHSNLQLPSRYLLSCFWEGQEGSFLLWTFWHSVLGLIVMKTAKGLESRTMSIIGLVQVCLATMLLGLYFGPEVKMGSTPFILLRDKMAAAPIFAQANYMDFIKDGNGLNPLLQNYWMVIHPPVLFLGFASTLIPFAFAMAALWKGEYQSWIKPTVNWSLFSGGIFVLGIMMGGAWAYESLSFGGYWAWDPVENASLVPWLTLVAGLHTLVIYKATGRSFITTMIFLALTYMLVWYSTFLTRTGVLGETSVHAFTGEGKSLYWHLLVVMAVLLILIIGLLAYKWKSLPRVQTEEKTATREFWMFIGSFVLLLSAMHIIISTSLPVWAPWVKSLLKKDIAPPTDVVAYYNNIQVWPAVIISILTATIFFLRFKTFDAKTVMKRLGIAALISLVVALGICLAMKIDAWQYATLMFTACFTVVAMTYYAIKVQSGAFKKRGGPIAHFGFGLLIIGMILSSYRKEVISFNTLGSMMNFNKKTTAENIQENRENVIMYKDVPVSMGEYRATYVGDSVDAPTTYFKVVYERIDSTTKEVKERFTLYPDVFINKKSGQDQISNNPSSKHYLTKDVFTYVNMFAKSQDTSAYKEHKMKMGDTVFFESGYYVFSGFNKQMSDDPRYVRNDGDLGIVSANLKVYSAKGFVEDLQPLFILRKSGVEMIEDTSKEMALYARFTSIIPAEDAAVIMTKQNTTKGDYIVLKAIVFPFINIVWLGIIVMVSGFFISLYNRMTKKDKDKMPQVLAK